MSALWEASGRTARTADIRRSRESHRWRRSGSSRLKYRAGERNFFDRPAMVHEFGPVDFVVIEPTPVIERTGPGERMPRGRGVPGTEGDKPGDAYRVIR